MIALVMMVLLLASAYFLAGRVLADAYAVASLRLFSNAALAYEYGNQHFSSKNPAVYDIDRAEYFFNEAYRLDPTLPYVRHQLARVAFLRGDFETALSLINSEIALKDTGPDSQSSYYIRALINAYRGDYAASGEDYKKFLETHPTNWAAINDYAWVLLQDGRARKAVDVSLKGLRYHPKNPWLLNTNAIALHEIGLTDAAQEQVKKATQAMLITTEQDWLTAYPGNDPRIAEEGLLSFKDSVRKNMHTMTVAELESRYNGSEE